MYIFEATYENMDTFTERKTPIKFDGQFLETDQECYVYAMRQQFARKDFELQLKKGNFQIGEK